MLNHYSKLLYPVSCTRKNVVVHFDRSLPLEHHGTMENISLRRLKEKHAGVINRDHKALISVMALKNESESFFKRKSHGNMYDKKILQETLIECYYVYE